MGRIKGPKYYGYVFVGELGRGAPEQECSGVTDTWAELEAIRKKKKRNSGSNAIEHKAFATRDLAQQFVRDCLTDMRRDREKKVKRQKTVEVEEAKAGIQLNEKQEYALQLVNSGESVFITGQAGTGKSFLLERIKARLAIKYRGIESVRICAMTGIAASHIGGCTLHSFLGCGVILRPDDFRKCYRHKSLIRACEALVVDEISMASRQFLEGINEIFQEIRGRNNVLFGGIQVIFVGDFLQLPPIEETEAAVPFKNSGLAFEANFWHLLKVVQLVDSVRQEGDQKFADALSLFRFGEGQPLIDMMKMHCELHGDPPVNVLQLFTTNQAAAELNQSRLLELPGKTRVYRSFDQIRWIGGSEKGLWERILVRMVTPELLELKEGARVLLTCNLDIRRGLVNGSMGTVKSFLAERDSRQILEESVEKLKVELGSRLGQDRLEIEALLQRATMHLHLVSRNLLCLPLVRFDCGVEQLMLPHSFSMELSEFGGCQRTQIPLVLAWGITMHKSQGMTLSACHCDLDRIFAEGQAYTALSRVRSVHSLTVRNLQGLHALQHPKCIAYYRALQ